MTKSKRNPLKVRYDIPYYHFNQTTSEWERIETNKKQIHVLETLRIFSYNVLFDMHNEDLPVTSEQRVPHVLRILENCDADIICLQEVRTSFLEILVQLEWVKDKYYISDVSGAETLGDKYGQVVLSKMEPYSLSMYRFSNWKSYILPLYCVLIDGVKEYLLVPVIHLTSGQQDEKPQAPIQRRAQLETVFYNCQYLQADHCIIVGDFNFSDGQIGNELIQKWGRDAWLEINDISINPGYSLNPVTNPTAYMTIKIGKDYGRRIDKMVIRSDKLITVSTNIAATETFTVTDEVTNQNVAMCPSDHYALDFTFVVNRTDKILPELPRKRINSLAAIALPSDLWKPFLDIQQKHMRSTKFGPHITLLHPFLPYHLFDQAEREIRDALQNFKPFDITLRTFDYAGKTKNCIMYLKPETNPPDTISELQTILQNLYPHCDDVVQRTDSKVYAPIITMGMINTPNEVKKFMKLYQAKWKPVTFTVKEIYLMSRVGDEQYQVRNVIPLGTNSSLDNIATDSYFTPLPEPE
jgi:endonuclease/exonuclease/phosphatase family metal-dependent hydrolase/2'-5' RNA ligase